LVYHSPKTSVVSLTPALEIFPNELAVSALFKNITLNARLIFVILIFIIICSCTSYFETFVDKLPENQLIEFYFQGINLTHSNVSRISSSLFSIVTKPTLPTTFASVGGLKSKDK